LRRLFSCKGGWVASDGAEARASGLPYLCPAVAAVAG
jgi:hypothetical protein